MGLQFELPSDVPVGVHEGQMVRSAFGGFVHGSLDLFSVGSVAGFFLTVRADVLGMTTRPGVRTQGRVVCLA